jgi:hypothetical protein
MRVVRSAAVILACMTAPAAGCQGGDSRPTIGGPSTTASQAPSSSGDSKGSLGGTGWWEAPLLTEPKYSSKVIVAEQKGSGDKDLSPLLSNGREPIRIVIACSGSGSITLLVDHVDNGSRVSCDEVRTFMDIYTDPGERRITLTSGPDTRWKVAVIRK